ncbi:MAG: hypothetical protein ABR964_04410 [Tepidisphaeraceae bacterium]|jgi:hypothetical protein
MKIPRIIPPKTLVRLSRYDDSTPHWRKQMGREFRIGYYSPRDGSDCIWLVNKSGQYEQTIDRATLLMYFDIVRLSHETNLYGANRGSIGRRRERRTAVV